MIKIAFPLAGLLSLALLGRAKDFTLHTFKKVHLNDQFWSEGANVGDFNKDGKMDIVSGPYWWEGPDFKVRHEYYPATKTFELKLGPQTKVAVPGFKGALSKDNDYSDNFFAFTYDLNKDGWDDILIYGFPGAEATWYENPKSPVGGWKKHVVFAVTDNESPMFADLTGDGQPELIGGTSREVAPKERKGTLGYASPDWSDPTKPWKWHPITGEEGRFQRFTHGIGFGDLNGDGRNDVLEANGWWEQPASLVGDPVWKFHAMGFAPGSGSAQMYVFDINGDGRNDVISSLAAHGFGLAWYEQLAEKDEKGSLKFQQHIIMNKEPKENKYGVKFSQLHAVDLIDMDGDGLKDIVTGKRFWAHGPTGDAEPNAPAVLYWFKLVRNSDQGVDFIPYLIDDNSGVGTQVVVRDVNGDNLPDVLVGNKKGTFVHLHSSKQVGKEEWEKAQPKPYAPTNASAK